MWLFKRSSKDKRSASDSRIIFFPFLDFIIDDIWLLIFSYLCIQDLISVAQVSKNWYRIITKPNEKEPSLLAKVDDFSAQPWIDKIKQELTEFPPVYPNNKTQRYRQFYNKMKVQLYFGIWNGHTDFAIFSMNLESYYNRKLDVRLQKLLEKNRNNFFFQMYVDSRTNVEKMFNSDSISCFRVILSFLDKTKRSVLLHNAVGMRNGKFVEELVKFDVDLTLREQSLAKLTALALAHKNGDTHILTILCEKISTQEADLPDPSSHDFRENFYSNYGISYQLYLKSLLHREKQKDVLFETQSKVDEIIQELVTNLDPKFVDLLHTIIQKKDDVLLEKLNVVLEEHQVSSHNAKGINI